MVDFSEANKRIKKYTKPDGKVSGAAVDKDYPVGAEAVIHGEHPLSKARGHLDKQVERGDHAPKVGGHGTSQHGGRVLNSDGSGIESPENTKLRASIKDDSRYG